ncbi:hypothetical protein DBR11_19995 [Pedobacter sp. HMWF019]|uniref:SGNH/GDSL hydrolase family protein n=1 Tax=Pedobacter sp. HMWF019 TaxID=2056856 RepID=UPI000D37F185|nr:SGNH/GDSL hydrolase family protein [Pedobacter sp. HMWF019]PTS95967.1 hypothetical protein DBR11_19995 [Pedobacter sp. HMWF019]
MLLPRPSICYLKVITLALGLILLQSCNKRNSYKKLQNIPEDDTAFAVSGETITLSGEKVAYLLRKDAKINNVYKIGENGSITIYKKGLDYLLTPMGGIKRTAKSLIPDFSHHQVKLNRNGKFTFKPGPDRNPETTLKWQVMVDYSTHLDSMIKFKGGFLSNDLKEKIRAKKDISIYCIGTSISAGAHTVQVFFNGMNTSVYVQLIAKAITKLYKNKVLVTNLAEGGATTQLFTEKLEEIKLKKPDLIFIEFGMNEHGADNRILYHLQAIEAGVKSLISEKIDCVLIGFFQQNLDFELEKPSYTMYFNRKLKEISEKNNVFFADIYERFNQFPKEKVYNDLLGDYLHHPTDFGHQIYYLTTVPVILFGDKKESELLRIIE